MNPRVSTAVAFLIAPLPPAFAAALSSPVVGGGVDASPIDLLGLTLVVFYPFALFFGLLIGLPLFFLARRFNLVRWWSAAIAGFVTGVIALALSKRLNSGDVPLLLMWAGSGSFAGFTFWFVWRTGNRPGASNAAVGV